ELLRELVPGAARVAVLVNPANAVQTESTLRDVEPAARAIGLQIQVLNAGHHLRRILGRATGQEQFMVGSMLSKRHGMSEMVDAVEKVSAKELWN
ncbi:MAG: hypothetical protein ACJ8EA_00490, partial [Xanthobacteraceae bacterium]